MRMQVIVYRTSAIFETLYRRSDAAKIVVHIIFPRPRVTMNSENSTELRVAPDILALYCTFPSTSKYFLITESRGSIHLGSKCWRNFKHPRTLTARRTPTIIKINIYIRREIIINKCFSYLSGNVWFIITRQLVGEKRRKRWRMYILPECISRKSF